MNTQCVWPPPTVTAAMSYYQHQYDNMGYAQAPTPAQMTSYVAVQGVPSKDGCHVFGLTPKEVRYLMVSHRNKAFL